MTDLDPQFQKFLLALVEHHGKRDSMSGARKASMILTIDEGREMVVTATIHDRRRERIIGTIAMIVSVIGAVMVSVGVGTVFFH